MVFLTLGILGNLSAQMQLFKGTFDEAMNKARQEKKDLFVDFYANWCGPCKAMASEVFPDAKVGEYFNAHFVCVQVDVEAKENKELAKKYNVTALPTMAFIGRDGKELRRVQGAVPSRCVNQRGSNRHGRRVEFRTTVRAIQKEKEQF